MGSNEGFNENVKINTALLRKRLQSTDLKVENMSLGVRTNTLVNLVYMDGIVKKGLLEHVKARLSDFVIDGILDSGMAEQLTEETWAVPIPADPVDPAPGSGGHGSLGWKSPHPLQ